MLRGKLVCSAAAPAILVCLFGARLGFAYALEGAKWPGSTVHMIVQVGTPSFVLPDGFVSWNADAENALAQWNEQLGRLQFTWSEAAVGSHAGNHDGVNEVLFANGAYNYNFGSGVLAVTLLNYSGGTMLETDVLFNPSNHFTSGGNVNPGKDFHRVALHEFGHVLGLDHPDEATPKQKQISIMHSTVTSLNHLTDDDVAGVVFLYGAPPNPPPVTGNARLANISTRASVGNGDNVLIAGFVVQNQTKPLLLRSLGPMLVSFGIANPLADPFLELHGSSGSLIATNDNWKTAQQNAIQQTGLAPPNDLESAMLATLPPSSYTAVMRGNQGTTGVGLVEVYDLQTASGRVSNISSRGLVAGGNAVMIAGFSVHGPQLKAVVLRGIGPGLRSLGIINALPNTTIELRNSRGGLITSNTGWQNDPLEIAVESKYLQPRSTADSAIYIQLAPGNYTLVLKSPTNAVGVGLVEVYDVD